jgi:Predicted membrane protein
MSDFITALLFVVVAEMGDKTQLLAMAMASKYKAGQVMLGVFIATIFNHALAVALGSCLGSVIPTDKIKIVAAVSFLVFGLWTLRGDRIDEDEKKKAKFGPVVTVAIAFFIAEMGDKTQLMTISIAAKSHLPLLVLMGTTTGMLIADGIGILGGAWMAKNVPDKYIKWGAGLIFLFFGVLTLYESVPTWLLNPVYIILFFLLLGFLIWLIGVKFAYNESTQTQELSEESEI